MSRVFKSEQCLEALPCKLEPASPVSPALPEIRVSIEKSPPDDNSESKKLAEKMLTEARNQADALIQSARNEADKILAAANEEVARLKEETYRTAFEKAVNDGRETVKRQMTADLQKAAAILNEAEVIRTERIASSEPELLKLSVAIAQKIISHELKLDTSAIRGIISNALAKVTGATNIKIRIHPEDFEMLSAADALNFETVLGEPKPIHFEADPAIARGGCFIETEMGNVDARIQMQLETIVTELLKVGRLS